jgi:hypothetical protein
MNVENRYPEEKLTMMDTAEGFKGTAEFVNPMSTMKNLRAA